MTTASTPSNAPAASLLEATSVLTYVQGYADQSVGSVDGRAAYYYHAATQEGDHGPLEDGLADLLKYPGTYSAARYAPKAPNLRFDDAAMRDVQRWLLDQGDHILFIYGERDPWTATAASIPSGRDVYKIVQPGGNHESTVFSLPDADRALGIIARWARVTIE